MSLEGKLTCCPSAIRASENEEIEKDIDEGWNSKVFTYYFEAPYHRPTIWMKLGTGLESTLR